MPRPNQLVETEISLEGGYFPSVPSLSSKNFQNTINAGSGVWVRPGGRIQVANGLEETSATNVGARIFAADVQRATIAGGLVGNRLPYAGLLRHDNACIFFVSEEASAQVYLNESSIPGMTTSSSPGRLRLAIPDGAGGYDTVDAGFDKPVLASGDVSVPTAIGAKNMHGVITVALAPWRISTDSIGPMSDAVTVTCTVNTGAVIRINLPGAASAQDGWIYCGSRWNDQSGALRVVRYVRLTPRGTFTATNGSPILSAGQGTFFTEDLFAGDHILLDSALYSVISIQSDTQATLFSNFTGITGAGKTATVVTAGADWFDGGLGDMLETDIVKPPRCAGVLQFAGRNFVWGCFGETEDSPTGSVILPSLPLNPEHCGIKGIRTASGSNLVNVLGGDGPLYLMTTTSLEIATLSGDPALPFIVKIIAEPGFKTTTNGILYTDTFYGYNGAPLRTRADENIDVAFAAPVLEDMRDWNPERVIIERDPKNQAVLYIHDDGSETEVIPFMTQLGVWGPPINLSARILDAQVVNGALYVTYLDGGNTRVNEWEGGSGIGGSPYVATQYLDPNLLNANRLKQLTVAGKVVDLNVFAVAPGQIPDVSDTGQAAATFPLSDTANTREETIHTNLAGDAYAFRFNLGTNGEFQKLVVGGLPRSGRR